MRDLKETLVNRISTDIEIQNVKIQNVKQNEMIVTFVRFYIINKMPLKEVGLGYERQMLQACLSDVLSDIFSTLPKQKVFFYSDKHVLKQLLFLNLENNKNCL